MQRFGRGRGGRREVKVKVREVTSIEYTVMHVGRSSEYIVFCIRAAARGFTCSHDGGPGKDFYLVGLVLRHRPR
jgi:hypothetical protein